jgi:hypothetical protein
MCATYLSVLAGNVEHVLGAERPLLVARQATHRQNKLRPEHTSSLGRDVHY